MDSMRACISMNDSPSGNRNALGKAWTVRHSRRRRKALSLAPVHAPKSHSSSPRSIRTRSPSRRAIGLAVSTLTEHAIGAIAALAIFVVASEITDQVPQFAVIQPYLPTHWWNSFDALLRVPIDSSTLLKGLLSFAVYLLIFGSFAWARFTTADVTS